jgi:hypothetical protein
MLGSIVVYGPCVRRGGIPIRGDESLVRTVEYCDLRRKAIPTPLVGL